MPKFEYLHTNKEMKGFKETNDRNLNLLREIIGISVILCCLVLLLFTINQTYNSSLPIATDIVGQYGDFVGGVIGTLLTVGLLYLTFKSQIEEFGRNASVFATQQFNDNFFHLLKQYQEIVNSLIVKYPVSESSNYEHLKEIRGKEAVHYFCNQIQETYDKDDNNSGRKAAVRYYQEFYANHKDFAPIYFRTLYRILDLVDRSRLDEKEKVRYAKILRSQMTDYELSLLRYNAMTVIGKPMRGYIVKYNLLKHTSFFDIIEYHYFASRFQIIDQHRVNMILYIIRKLFHEVAHGQITTKAHTSLRCKYNINVTKFEAGKSMKLDFSRRSEIKISLVDDFSCFESVDINGIKDICYTWLNEIFFYSNFGLNNRISMTSKMDKSDNNREHFSITIISKTDGPLEI